MITYRGKKYVFLEKEGFIDLPDEMLKSLPKAVLLLLMAGAARGTVQITNGTLTLLSGKMGQYLDNGQLNAAGQRVFKHDRELLAALNAATPLASAPPPEARKHAEENTLQTGSPPPAAEVVERPSSEPCRAALLVRIQQFLLRFVVFGEPSHAIAVSLWIAHTWVLDAFRVTPYLHIFSPTKRCGKSRLLECLHALVCRPWSVVSATEATIMRKVDAEKPTLLYDEVDAVYRSSRDKSKEGLRAVLNCGFARGAKVPRCAGREIIEYSVFCPKAFAGIGDRLPDTIRDRSIRIQLIRRAREQIVEKLRFRDLEESTKTIVDGLTSWSADEDVIQTLQASCPEIPSELGDRAADIAEPLLAIADLACGEWPKSARASLLALLRVNDDEEADEPGVRLLAAIREIFVAEAKKQMPTIQILRRLAARDEEEAWTMQWSKEFAGGNTRGPAAKMATLLRPYGISAGTIRLPDGTTPKGYRLDAFTDAFARYLPDPTRKDATTPHCSLEQAAGESPTTPADTEEIDHENS